MPVSTLHNVTVITLCSWRSRSTWPADCSITTPTHTTCSVKSTAPHGQQNHHPALISHQLHVFSIETCHTHTNLPEWVNILVRSVFNGGFWTVLSATWSGRWKLVACRHSLLGALDSIIDNIACSGTTSSWLHLSLLPPAFYTYIAESCSILLA